MDEFLLGEVLFMVIPIRLADYDSNPLRPRFRVDRAKYFRFRRFSAAHYLPRWIKRKRTGLNRGSICEAPRQGVHKKLTDEPISRGFAFHEFCALLQFPLRDEILAC